MFGSIAFFFTDSSESDNEDTSFLSQSVHYTKLSRNRYDSKQRLHFKQHHCSYSSNDSRLQLKLLRDATNVLELPKEEFLRLFRVSKVVFSSLLEELTQIMQPTYRSTHIPAPIKLAKFLQFIATGVGTVDHEYASAMCKSQISKTITEMLDTFVQHLYTKWVKLYQNEEDENSTKQHFYNRLGIPGIVGCVDNTHVRIKAPDKEARNLYNNSKGFTSLNVMIICDHNMVIKYVDGNQPGSYNDAYIWDQSTADNYFRTNYKNGKTNTWVVGDSSYKLLPYLMIPYKNPKEEHHKFLNEKLYKASDIIKQCVSVLKNRFSCLITPKGLYYSPEKSAKTIIACCILHNICISHNDNWLNVNDIEEDIDNEVIADDDDDSTDMSYEEYAMSRSIRDGLALLPTPTIPDIETSQSSQDYNSESKDIRLHFYNLRHDTNVFNFPDDKFMKNFRVNKKVFSVLLEEITPKLKATFRCTHTPAPIKLAIFLAFIATGGQHSTIEHDYNLICSKSQMSRVINEMLDIFEEHLYGKWIKLEQDPEDEHMTKENFSKIAGIPGVVGCVDNTHIQIKTPAKEVKYLYYNRNDFCSLNVMMICDHNMVIKYVDAYQPGSYHDAYVWDQSSADNYFKTKHSKGITNTLLIGDSAYKLQPYMMIPYKNPTQDYEHKFNEKHFETRKIIKNCIDILKNRFRCLISTTGLQYTPEKASKIVITCCILHNICITYKNDWLPSDITFEDHDDDQENIIKSSNIKYAMSIRNNIAKNLSLNY